MNLMNRVYIIFFVLFFVKINISFSQSVEKLLSINDFIEGVIRNHPVVKQANLLTEQARQELLMVRGAGFDPKLVSTWDEKTFQSKEYYNIWQNYIKVPTWFGAEFKAGYDEVYGSNVNPERKIPSNGLSYVGVSVPLGSGLFIDQRRATLRQAQVFQKLNEAEKIKTINKIIFEASKDYWEWYFRYFRFKNAELGFSLAQNRYSFVKKRVNLGEEAPIDSTEALILLQNRIVNLNSAQVDWLNASLALSNHIWDANSNPMEIDTTLKPPMADILSPENEVILENLLSFAAKNHPEIQKFSLKLRQLQIEKNLAVENIKPQINLNYSLINSGFNPISGVNSEFAQNNYKAGFNIEIPIFYRKEIGKIQLTKAKMKSTSFERDFVSRQIANQISSYYNEMKNIESILIIQKKLIDNYTILRAGEIEKFNNGESSLFLVNSRESSLLESQLKLVELEAKFFKTKAGLFWAASKID